MNVLDEAVIFAVKAHEGQKRKMFDLPYILHPMEVAQIISTMTEDKNVMAAGALHDTVEDCGVDPEEIRRRFGPRVAALVLSETEDKLAERPPEETWMERKKDSLLMLKYTKDTDVKILWLADKLSNLRSFYRAKRKIGDEIYENLHQKDPMMHRWYYLSVAEYTGELAETDAHREVVELIDKVFPDTENERKE